MPAIEDNDNSDNKEVTDSEVSGASPAPSHFLWDCLVNSSDSPFPIPIRALIDNGSGLVMINEATANQLHLECFPLKSPQLIDLAVSDGTTPTSTSLTHFVKICPVSIDQTWSSSPV
jgi:predicted aspartyl protease